MMMRRRRTPWYLRAGPNRPPQDGSANGAGATAKKPKETWPVVIFDFAKCNFCARLDSPAGVDQHVHVVPLTEMDIEFNVWGAPPEEAWHAGLPTTHDSVAALFMFYDVSDKASFALVEKYIGQAQSKLTEGELDGYALLTIVIVGVTDAGANAGGGGATERVVTKGEGLKLASARKALFLEAPCATAANVHDVMISASQEIFSRAAKRRDQELAKDDAMKNVNKAVEGVPGFFGNTVDKDALEASIQAARQAGCSDQMLAKADSTLAESLKEPKSGGGGGLTGMLSCCAQRH